MIRVQKATFVVLENDGDPIRATILGRGGYSDKPIFSQRDAVVVLHQLVKNGFISADEAGEIRGEANEVLPVGTFFPLCKNEEGLSPHVHLVICGKRQDIGEGLYSRADVVDLIERLYPRNVDELGDEVFALMRMDMLAADLPDRLTDEQRREAEGAERAAAVRILAEQVREQAERGGPVVIGISVQVGKHRVVVP